MIDQVENTELPRDEELLLPWYVSGKISDSDKAKVEAWLEASPEAGAHLERAIEEMDMTFADSENLGYPSRDGIDRLLASVGETGIAENKTGFVERIWEMLSPRYAMAGAAALALVVIAQSSALTIMMQQDTAQPTFETASAEQVVSVDQKRALVSFSPDLTLTELQDLLTDLDLTIVDGPKPGGIFEIAAPLTDKGAESLATLANDTQHVAFFSELP